MAEKELEQFRRQWQQEVSARNRGSIPRLSPQASSSRPKAGTSLRPAPAPTLESRHRPEDDHVRGWNFDDIEEQEEARRLKPNGSSALMESQQTAEPQSALEHYEKAVEYETQGKLGDSLAHYRRAFRLDDRVDVKYKNKHFPPSSFPPKPPGINNANNNVDAVNTAHHSLHGPPGTISSLVASFANTPILGAPPIIERTLPPPCPIASVPQEILTEILLRTAIRDVASFARLSLVCKRLAYHVAAEDRIWKRVCHGPEFGFNGMHYAFGCTISGQSLRPETELPDVSTLSLTVDPSARTLDETSLTPLSLSLTPAYPTYRHMHHTRPRLRFAGLYISTVNYIRPGASSATAVTWNSPVHVVTYYRYLRFFRSGACLSLQTTAEPSEVVPHLKPENVGLGQGAVAAAGGGAGIVAVARSTLKGRWRISALDEMKKAIAPTESDVANADEPSEPEGNVYVETEGPTRTYTFCMQLALRSAGGGERVRNTKLVWRGFWSYNKLSDDWAEFGLKNDRAFVWSRVKSWADS